jgi:NADH-quinone oxidoreductase subunit A
MIFILFDIEMIFLMPWAVVFKDLAARTSPVRGVIFWEMILFIGLVGVGFVYVWKKGLFDWGQRARQEAEAQARALALIEGRADDVNRGTLGRAA